MLYCLFVWCKCLFTCYRWNLFNDSSHWKTKWIYLCNKGMFKYGWILQPSFTHKCCLVECWWRSLVKGEIVHRYLQSRKGFKINWDAHVMISHLCNWLALLHMWLGDCLMEKWQWISGRSHPLTFGNNVQKWGIDGGYFMHLSILILFPFLFGN